ncbi:spore germination protein [Bacillus timonensis]|nr:spore germination protein [Bacillus timonensis]
MMKVISYRQLLTMLFLLLPITGHLLLVGPILSISGRDAWVTILIAYPIGFLYAMCLYRIHTLKKNQPLHLLIKQSFGNIFGGFLTCVFLLYFLYMLVITLYTVMDFLHLVYFTRTPMFFIGITFYAVVLYGIFKGIESVARTSEPFAYLIFITGSIIGFSSLRVKEWDYLFPILQSDFSSLLLGVLLTVSVYGEFVLLLFLTLDKHEKNSFSLKTILVISTIFVTVTFLGTVTGSIMIFGIEQAQISEYPPSSILKVVSLGFIEQVDIYGIFTLVIGSVIRMSVFQIVAGQIIPSFHIPFLSKATYVQLFISTFTLFICIFVIDNHLTFMDEWITGIYPYTFSVSIVIPLIVWVILERKQKNEAKEY